MEMYRNGCLAAMACMVALQIVAVACYAVMIAVGMIRLAIKRPGRLDEFISRIDV